MRLEVRLEGEDHLDHFFVSKFQASTEKDIVTQATELKVRQY